MGIDELTLMFNRAWQQTFLKPKLFLVSLHLFVCGLLVIFFRSLAVHAGPWMVKSMTFLPIFLSSGILLSMGVLLIRIYHDEVKQRSIQYKETLKKSWDTVIGTSYIFIPVILCYLILWMLSGLFYLLGELPLLGEMFQTILVFGPFLLNLGSLLLCVLSLMLLFLVTPVVALKSASKEQIASLVLERIRACVFTNICLLLLALVPFILAGGLLVGAAILTTTSEIMVSSVLRVSVEWFFMMIPFTALLSPAVIFFFNLAAESHVFMQKRLRV